MLEAGSTFGAYRIEELLGRGAMGEVYRAVDTRQDRVVALKLVRQELAESAVYRQRLANEAEATSRIDSQYVITVWEHAIEDGIPFFAMELVEGHILTEATAEFDLEKKLAIALQIAGGIQAAHVAGLIHRDLKPDNIMLTKDNEVRILDFGLAKPVLAESVDEHGDIAGTLHYIAPEQLAGESVTFACDQFSFGAILYELIVDRRPFEGDYPASIVYSLLHEEPIPPEEIDHRTPKWLSVFILKLLAKRPADRFEDMATVAEYIRSSLEGVPLTIEGEVTTRKLSVTVVDLKNLSGDENWNYFCEGFTDDVIGDISRRTDLIVSAQPSEKLPRDIRELFKRCRSDFVISGSIMRWQEKIRVKLFVYGDDGERLISSETYDGGVDQLFDLLSRVARETAIVLANVTGQSVVEVGEYVDADVSAYDYYLKGKSYYQTNKPENLEFAVTMYEKALEIDPKFALACSGLSDVYTFQYMAYYDRTSERMSEAKRLAQQALEINPRLPEAHRSLGRYYMFHGDVTEAEQSFLKTIELSPKYAVGYRTLAWLKYQVGDRVSALDWAQRSLQLAPTDVETLLLIGLLHTYSHKYTAAMATLERAIEICPDYGRAYYNLGLVYMKMAVHGKALDNLKLAAKYEGDPNCHIDAGFIYIIRNEYEQARDALQRSIDADFFPFVAYYYLGFLEKICGDESQSCEYYEKSLSLMRTVDFSNPENIQIMGFYALAQIGAGQIEAAQVTLEDLLSRDDLIGDVLLNAARCFALLEKRDRAEETLERAYETQPGPTRKETALDPHFALLFK